MLTFLAARARDRVGEHWLADAVVAEMADDDFDGARHDQPSLGPMPELALSSGARVHQPFITSITRTSTLSLQSAASFS